MSRPEVIFAADGETPYYYEPDEERPDSASCYVCDDMYFEAWSLAVESERTKKTLSRRDYMHLVAKGPDCRDDVLAARRLIEKGRYT